MTLPINPGTVSLIRTLVTPLPASFGAVDENVAKSDVALYSNHAVVGKPPGFTSAPTNPTRVQLTAVGTAQAMIPLPTPTIGSAPRVLKERMVPCELPPALVATARQ